MTKLPSTLRNRDSKRTSNTSLPSDSRNSTISSPSDTKSTSDSAMLAQRLASDSSWADRYVPVTPDESEMTPTTPSVAGFDANQSDDEPPTYETATSIVTDHPQSLSQHQPLIPPQQDTIPSASRPGLFDGNYSRHETSNAINGTFTLRDSLDLSTTSGSISIRLDVKPGAHPAILKLKTQSGSIRVDDKQCDMAQDRSSGRMKPARTSSGPSRGLLWAFRSRSDRESEDAISPVTTSDDPRKQPGQHPEADDEAFTARVIHTTIETSSGSVGGCLLVTPGSETRITTSSGSIGIKLLSTGSGSKTRALSKLEQEYAHIAGQDTDSDLRSIFNTTSTSGSQHISISCSRSDASEGAIVSAIQAKHYVTSSASMNIHYPPEWSGLVHASSGGSGNCYVRGHGLEYEKRGKQEIFAWRNVDVEKTQVGVEVRGDGSGSLGFSC